jgi:hypothetical protein
LTTYLSRKLDLTYIKGTMAKATAAELLKKYRAAKGKPADRVKYKKAYEKALAAEKAAKKTQVPDKAAPGTPPGNLTGGPVGAPVVKNAGAGVNEANPEGTPMGSGTNLTETNSSGNRVKNDAALRKAIQDALGKGEGKDFQNFLDIFDRMLPELKLRETIDPQRQRSIDLAEQAARDLRNRPQEMIDAENRAKGLADTAGTESAAVREYLNRLKAQSEQGLMAPELTALREQGQTGIQDALSSAMRELRIGQAGRGVAGAGVSPAGYNLTNQALQSMRDLERDILLQNMGFKTAQQDKWGSGEVANSQDLWNRQTGAVNNLNAITNQNFETYWGARNAANNTFGGLSGSADQDIMKWAAWNADQAYKRAGDVMGGGFAGIGYKTGNKQTDAALAIQKQLAAMSGRSNSSTGTNRTTQPSTSANTGTAASY